MIDVCELGCEENGWMDDETEVLPLDSYETCVHHCFVKSHFS